MLIAKLKKKLMRITTIIPAYNSSKTLEQTLTSIHNQLRPSDQVILVDDGSRDNIAPIVQKFPGVEYYRKENEGVSAARNYGADLANGDWLVFCDADDVWHPQKLAVVETCARRFENSCFIFHDFFRFGMNIAPDASGVTEGRNTIFPIFRENRLTMARIMTHCATLTLEGLQWPTAKVFYGNVFQWLLMGNFVLPSAVAIKKECFTAAGGFDTSFPTAEDTEFFLRLSKKTLFFYIPLPLSGYRIALGGLTGNIPALLHHGMRALYKNAVNDPHIYANHKQAIHLAIARRYARLSSFNLKNRARIHSWIALIKGMRFAWYERSLWIIFLASLVPYVFLEAAIEVKRKLSRLDGQT
jgi:glycosyltransferase involved in cell wall biosynthesis